MVGKYKYPSPHSERAKRRWADQKAGRIHISARERLILFHLAKADAVKDIAHVAGVRSDTIRHYIARMMEKLTVRTRFQLGMWYASQLKGDE